MLSGALRGCGQQKWGVVANGVSNWVVGRGLEALLAFRLGWGAAGLWWGLAAASALQTLLLAALVALFDWDRQTRRAQRLVRSLSSLERR